MEKEEWRDVVGYEGLYKISSFGRVLAVGRVRGNAFNGFYKEHFLTIRKDKGGYFRAMLSKDGKARFIPVHRLVAEAFIPNVENKPQIDHIDGVRTNNNVSNLRWATNRENVRNPNTLCRKRDLVLGGNNPMAVPVVSVDIKTGDVRFYKAASEAMPEFGLDRRSSRYIGYCCKGLKYSYKGRKWYYESDYARQ